MYAFLPAATVQALMFVLLAHEFGHYFAGKFSRAESRPPIFIPLGVLTIGLTKVKDLNKHQILATALAGPLAGLLAALALAVYAVLFALESLAFMAGMIIVNELFSFIFGADGKKFYNAFKRN